MGNPGSDRGPAAWHPRRLFREENAGLLLDVTVFVANLLVMDPLARAFIVLVQRVDAGDRAATTTLAVFFAALFVLMPAGALMKRWHFHRRAGTVADPLQGCGGCLFNPIFYFSLQVVIFSVAAAFLFQGLGKASADDAGAAMFLTVIFSGLVLMIASTVLVYRYFSPPPRPPRYAWMRRPGTERVADALLFANMLGYQVFWNLLAQMSIPTVSGVGEFVGRLGFLVFVALLLYFPPRMLYLAEDMHRWRTWAGIGIANSVVVVRVVIGTA